VMVLAQSVRALNKLCRRDLGGSCVSENCQDANADFSNGVHGIAVERTWGRRKDCQALLT
jgi:hypothetical protein